MSESLNDKPPFFVLGAQRSGTTMLRLMVNCHSQLAVPHETAFMTVFYPRIGEYGDLSKRANAERLLDDISQHHLVRRGGHVTDRDAILARPIADFPDLIDAIMSEYALAQGKSRWGDKTPFYTPDIDILWQLFPNARFVHVVRDGRDVVLSQRNIGWMSNSLPRLAEDWRWKTTVCHKVGSVLGDQQYLEVLYEDLVTEPETTLRRVCEFVGVEFEPAMLEHERVARTVVPSESLQWHGNSVRAPDRSKLFAWKRKLSRADQIIFEQVAGPALDLFGYERTNLRSTLGSRLKNLYYSAIVRW